jgi:glutathione peroxidase
MSTIYEFSAKTLDGQEKPLADYAGKMLLVVNTASNCGFTPQYRGLESLYRKYHSQGFAVLGFPCNQFGAQEPGDAPEMAEFCSRRYDVTFPMFEKIDVSGEGAHPLYRFLKNGAKGILESERSSGISPNSWSIAAARLPPVSAPRRHLRISKNISKSCSEERGAGPGWLGGRKKRAPKLFSLKKSK